MEKLNLFSFNTYDNKNLKYKSICEEILEKECIKKFCKIKNYYDKHPIEFMENYLGIKLKVYQKIILKYLYGKK